MKWGFAQVAQQLYTTAAQFAEKDRMFAMATELRPDYFRMGIPWSYVARQKDPAAPNARDWSMVDSSINDAILLGSEIVMQVGLYRPTWGGWFGFGGAPATIADFAAFTTECVNRYKPGGPGIRTDGKYAPNVGKGVTIWECWNEQNVSPFWGRNIDPVDYTNHLKAFYAAIKAIQPLTGSTVLFGGPQHCQRVGPYFGQGSTSVDETTFVKSCYAAGAKGYFDAMTFHYYQATDTVSYNGSTPGPAPSANTDCFRQLTEIRAEMVARGDSALNIWITEVGWSTNEVSQAQQLAYMQTLYAMIRDLGYVYAFIIYNVRNDGSSLTEAQQGWGAMDYNFVKKPLWNWLRTLSSPTPPRAAATVQAITPKVTITQPNLTVTPPLATASASAVVPSTKQSFSIAIPGSGTTIPATFDTYGDGMQLNSGTLTELAHPNYIGGRYYSGFVHNVPCLTFLHHSKVRMSNANGGSSDRSVGAVVGADDYANPLNYIEALACNVNYLGKNVVINQVINGAHQERNWMNIGWGNNDDLDFVVSFNGTNYVYSIYKNGAGSPTLTWTDLSGNPPAGKYIGAAVTRAVGSGQQWGSPGIKGTWTGGDV